MLIRAQMAADYVYGTTPSAGAEWWRPHNFNHSSEVVFAYTDNDFGKSGVSGLD